MWRTTGDTVHADPRGKTVSFGNAHEGTFAPFLVDGDGRNLRAYPFKDFAHSTWLGGTGIGQVYVVELPEEFREKAAHGYACRPGAFE